MPDERFIKIRLTGDGKPGETGWAEDLGSGLARISNIPFTGTFNIDDIVKLKKGKDDWLYPVELVSRRYSVRETVWYDHTGQYYVMHSIISLLGGKVEGGVTPTPSDTREADKPGNGDEKSTPGFMMVACPKQVDPLLLAKAIGIPHEAIAAKAKKEMEEAEEPRKGGYRPNR